MKWLIFGCILLLVAGIVVYEIIMPELTADAYRADVHRAAAKITPSFKKVEDSVSRPLLSDSSAPLAQKQADHAVVMVATKEVQADLHKLEETSKKLEASPLAGLTPQYQKALIAKQQLSDIHLQANAAINEYTQTANFLLAYAALQDTLEKKLAAFNATQDINTYNNRTAELRSTASDIRRDITTFNKQAAPSDLDELQQQLSATGERIATGFDMLAASINTGVDATIYQAVSALEKLDSELSDTLPEAYSHELENSRALKEIDSLTEKLDVLENY